MIAIKAHVNGSVVVPDEPGQLSPHDRVVVLIESASPASFKALEDATRAYYQNGEDDEGWGDATARDNRDAWGEE